MEKTNQEIVELVTKAEETFLSTLDPLVIDYTTEVSESVKNILDSIEETLVTSKQKKATETIVTEVNSEWVLKINHTESHPVEHKTNEFLLQQYLGEEHIVPEHWFKYTDKNSNHTLARLSQNMFSEKGNEPLSIAEYLSIDKPKKSSYKDLKEENKALFKSFEQIRNGLIKLRTDLGFYVDLNLYQNITIKNDQALIYDTDLLVYNPQKTVIEENNSMNAYTLLSYKELYAGRRRGIIDFYKFLDINIEEDIPRIIQRSR